MIEESGVPFLRQTAMAVLGELGEGVDEAAEYLLKIGEDENTSDELRLMALIELGRNESYFFDSIEILARWLGKGKKKRLAIQPEISDSFLDSLLKEGERSENHLIVVKEFIRSGILNAELKLRFSETLLSWDVNLENKAFLREAYSNPARDIKLYVEKDLFEEGIFEENYGASQFLLENISLYENIKNPLEILEEEIDTLIEEFKKDYSNQIKIAEKLEEIVNSYKEILETITN